MHKQNGNQMVLPVSAKGYWGEPQKLWRTEADYSSFSFLAIHDEATVSSFNMVLPGHKQLCLALRLSGHYKPEIRRSGIRDISVTWSVKKLFFVCESIS